MFILAVFFLLKVFVHDLLFDVFIYFCAIRGTFEMVRVNKESLARAEKVIVYAFALICIPVSAIGGSLSLFFVDLCFFAFGIALLSLLVIKNEKTTIENLGTALLSGVYPTLLLTVLCFCNHFEPSAQLAEYGFNSNLAILFVFVVSPVADSLAYVFGRFLKKYFPKKMAPKLSPNKTVIGGIGGLVGGLLAGVAIYFGYNAVCGSFDKMAVFLPIYLGVGLLTAAATAFGDLVESSLKRKEGVKDMGRIMPGHGGVLDRMDGVMFASVVVYFVFVCVNILF
jgi:phosphatidate cytidylyltransferase